MTSVTSTIIGINMLSIPLVSPVTGVPESAVLLISWITRVSAALLFIPAVRTPKQLDPSAAVLTIPLLTRPLMGTSLLARVDLLMEEKFLTITLLIGIDLLVPITRALFNRILLIGIRSLPLLCLMTVAPGVRPTSPATVLEAPFPVWVLRAPFKATRARTTFVDLKHKLTTKSRIAVTLLRLNLTLTPQMVQTLQMTVVSEFTVTSELTPGELRNRAPNFTWQHPKPTNIIGTSSRNRANVKSTVPLTFSKESGSGYFTTRFTETQNSGTAKRVESSSCRPTRPHLVRVASILGPVVGAAAWSPPRVEVPGTVLQLVPLMVRMTFAALKMDLLQEVITSPPNRPMDILPTLGSPVMSPLISAE